MPEGQRSTILLPLRRAVLLRDGAGLSDGQLLASFVERRDEAAFEALVRRHGPMVLGVCRRVLGCAHDADDAFQATFLVLARKAASIAPPDLVGNWLHGVARRTALCARAGNRRRRAKEKQVSAMGHPTIEPDTAWQELRALLDLEVSRLPVLYRVPVVLCDLEGRSRKDVARHLDVPEGTLSSRLATARRMLAARLDRRGLGLSGGALATILSAHAAACVPPTLVTSTVEAATAFAAGQAAAGVVSAKAAALVGGVLKAMSLTKLTIATVVVLSLAVLGSGTGWVLHQALADKPAEKAVTDGGKKVGVEVKGVIRAVDARAGTLTVQLDKEASGEQAFPLAKDARILLDDGTGDRLGFHEGKVADLAEGMPVILRLDEGEKVVRLLAEGPTFKGVLKSADAARGTITATIQTAKGEPAEDRTYPVAKAAKLHLEDVKKDGASKERGLADLPAGAFVVLKMSADQKVVGTIHAEGPTVAGVVKAVDADKGTITVTLKAKGEPDEDKTFTLAKEAHVSIDGKKDKAGRESVKDVPLGASVTLRLSLDQTAVVALQAEGATVHGVVTAVDIAKDTITVSQKGEGEKTYAVSKGVAVWRDGKAGKKLADVPVEAVVQLKLLVDQKTAGEIHAFGPDLHGAVSGNAGDDRITLATKEGATTYTVAKEAPIVVEEKRRGKLADLIDGTVARLRLSADKSEVLEIQAEGPSFKGTVKAVDADKGTITLTIGAKNGEGGEDKDFKVAKETVLTEASGVPVKLADLKVDTEVALRLSLDQKAAARITVGGE